MNITSGAGNLFDGGPYPFGSLKTKKRKGTREREKEPRQMDGLRLNLLAEGRSVSLVLSLDLRLVLRREFTQKGRDG